MDTHGRRANRPAYLRGMPASLWTDAITRRQRTSSRRHPAQLPARAARGTTLQLNGQTRINITRWAEEYISGLVQNHHGNSDDVRSIIHDLHDQSTLIDHDSGL